MLRIVKFGLIGGLASLTHLAVATAIFELFWRNIFVANTAGFVIAFFVSYFGHYHVTFESTSGHKTSLWRFLVTALFGYGVNTVLLAAITYLTGRETPLSLVVTIAFAAASVYLLSKRWAFAGGPPSTKPQ